MPNTVKVVVSETRNGKSMRWDYVKGEKGYTHDTKWIAFDLGRLTMTTHWKHKGELNFRTQGLGTFIQNGSGAFSAEEVTQNGKVNRITFELKSDTLSYLWETSPDGSHYSTYSNFEFKRDLSPGIAASNKE